MKIIYNKWMSFKWYLAIILFGVLFVRVTKEDMVNDITAEVINHESIHTVQMKEMGYIFFYLWYVLEYLCIRLFHKKQGDAYADVSFEEEAYNNDQNLDYLKQRKHYAWLKFIKIKSAK